jgi:hypothetical protein
MGYLAGFVGSMDPGAAIVSSKGGYFSSRHLLGMWVAGRIGIGSAPVAGENWLEAGSNSSTRVAFWLWCLRSVLAGNGR